MTSEQTKQEHGSVITMETVYGPRTQDSIGTTVGIVISTGLATFIQATAVASITTVASPVVVSIVAAAGVGGAVGYMYDWWSVETPEGAIKKIEKLVDCGSMKLQITVGTESVIGECVPHHDG